MASKKKEESNFIYFILMIFAILVFIIIVEVLLVSKVMKQNQDTYESLFSVKSNDKYYDVLSENAIDINLDNTTYINTICVDECSVKVENYYFIFKKDSDKYKLYATDGNRLLTTVNLGTSIKDVFLSKYEKDIIVFNKINTDSFNYDYMLVISPNDMIDEFTSLEANEMEIVPEGIIYYYDECNKGKAPNAYKIKAVRKPFDKKVTEISREEKNYPWCSK